MIIQSDRADTFQHCERISSENVSYVDAFKGFSEGHVENKLLALNVFLCGGGIMSWGFLLSVRPRDSH